jgi:peptidoglycan hydrolase-like protein with peptidoglycan-binding domain
MPLVVQELRAAGIALSKVRLWSAHYGLGEHICGPSTCAEGKRLGVAMDGTQWTDSASGANHSLIDASLLLSSFFKTTAPAPGPGPVQWTEFDMSQMQVLKKGSKDVPGGGFFWVVRLQDLVRRSGVLLNLPAAGDVDSDGNFGSVTDKGVRAVQEHYGIGVDGIAGQNTWSVLLTGTV